jgi:hypothetical protein
MNFMKLKREFEVKKWNENAKTKSQVNLAIKIKYAVYIIQ